MAPLFKSTHCPYREPGRFSKPSDDNPQLPITLVPEDSLMDCTSIPLVCSANLCMQEYTPPHKIKNVYMV